MIKKFSSGTKNSKQTNKQTNKKTKQTLTKYTSRFAKSLYHLSLERVVVIRLAKFEFPFIQGCFMPSSIESGPVVLKKIILKDVKNLQSDG